MAKRVSGHIEISMSVTNSCNHLQVDDFRSNDRQSNALISKPRLSNRSCSSHSEGGSSLSSQNIPADEGSACLRSNISNTTVENLVVRDIQNLPECLDSSHYRSYFDQSTMRAPSGLCLFDDKAVHCWLH